MNQELSRLDLVLATKDLPVVVYHVDTYRFIKGYGLQPYTKELAMDNLRVGDKLVATDLWSTPEASQCLPLLIVPNQVYTVRFTVFVRGLYEIGSLDGSYYWHLPKNLVTNQKWFRPATSQDVLNLAKRVLAGSAQTKAAVQPAGVYTGVVSTMRVDRPLTFYKPTTCQH